MDKYNRAVEMFAEYVRLMQIDAIAVPEQSAKCVNIVLFNAIDLVGILAHDLEDVPALLTIEKGEEFFRVKRLYHAVKMWNGLQALIKHRIPTQYKKVSDIPVWRGMKARGFEKVVAEYVNGEHTGDDVKQVDVISSHFGRIECKIGGGRLYYAGTTE